MERIFLGILLLFPAVVLSDIPGGTKPFDFWESLVVGSLLTVIVLIVMFLRSMGNGGSK